MNDLVIVCPYCGKILGEIDANKKQGDIYCNLCQKWVKYKVIKDENGKSIKLDYL